jgi:hypothetical protein
MMKMLFLQHQMNKHHNLLTYHRPHIPDAPVSFSISEGDLPSSPLVAKSSAGGATAYEKLLPVKR